MRRAREPLGVNGGVDTRTVGIGFVGAVVVTGLLLWVVGVGAVLDALARADPSRLLVVGVVATVWLTAWGLSLRTVLGVLGQDIGVLRAVAVYSSAVFANNVTPFGQAGGEPFSAYLISSETEVEYETGFAAISSVDALHFVPSLTLGVLGLAYLGTSVTLGRQLTLVAGVVAALAVGIPLLGYYVYRNRERVEHAVGRVLTPVVRRVGSVVPGVEPLTEAEIESRIEAFFLDIDRVATDRRGLALALGYSALGWLALAASLWCSLWALGYAIPVAVAIVAIPVGDLAAAMPLPGGLGGLEALLVLVLVTLTSVSAPVAMAAALVHRVATYFLPMVLGGGVAAVIATD